MSNNEKKEIIQWGYELIKNAYLNKVQEPDLQDELYLNYLFPFSKEIYSLGHSVLLFGGHSFKTFNQKPFITVRDGIIPLTIFFGEMRPDEFKLDIYIPKDLWFIVPDEWRGKVRFYEIKSDEIYSAHKLPEKIFVSGILNSTLADPDQFEASIKRLADGIGKENLKNIEVIAYFPDKRNDLWGSWEEENVLSYSSAIFRHLGLELKTPRWGDLKNEMNFRNCLYHEVNSGLFIKDSYLSHFALSRGAGLLAEEPKPEEDNFNFLFELRNSLYHKYNFYEFDYSKVEKFSDPLKSNQFTYFKRLIEFQNKDVRLNFEWEKWYASYIKRFYKNNKPTSRSSFNI